MMVIGRRITRVGFLAGFRRSRHETSPPIDWLLIHRALEVKFPDCELRLYS